MISKSHIKDGAERDMNDIILRIEEEHSRCRVFINAGKYDLAAESLRNARGLLGELLVIVDCRNAEHRRILNSAGMEHTRCTRLVCSAHCIQASEALLQDRALYPRLAGTSIRSSYLTDSAFDAHGLVPGSHTYRRAPARQFGRMPGSRIHRWLRRWLPDTPVSDTPNRERSEIDAR